MKQRFIINQHHSRLILFFAGWGMDEHPFLPSHRQEDAPSLRSDLMICYDYRSLAFDETALREYQEIRLVAWSMGVWAAAQVLQNSRLPFSDSIAINGTPYPVDEERGIPPSIFQGTLEGLCENSLRKFQRRMCADAVTFNRFQSVAPHRSLEEAREELSAIGEQCRSLPLSIFQWNQAVIGNNDRIFPPVNQAKAWENSEITLVYTDEAHYSERLFHAYLAESKTNNP